MKKLTLAALITVGALTACAQPQKEEAQVDIAGEWVLTVVNGEDVSTTVRADKIINFDVKENRFNAKVGCNNLFGGININESNLSIGQVASTMMACDKAAMDMDQKVSRTLEQTQSYVIQKGELILLNSKGEAVTRWKRAEPKK